MAGCVCFWNRDLEIVSDVMVLGLFAFWATIRHRLNAIRRAACSVQSSFVFINADLKVLIVNLETGEIFDDVYDNTNP